MLIDKLFLIALTWLSGAESMNIKWTAGPGPAPLPYSKKYRDSLSTPEKDLPSWYFPDSHEQNVNPLKSVAIVIIFISISVIVWILFRRRKARMIGVPLSTTAITVDSTLLSSKASKEEIQEAREARLKRFEEAAAIEAEKRRKETYASAMAGLMGKSGDESTNLRQRKNNNST